MRRTVLAVLAMVAIAAGCQPSTETAGSATPDAGQTTAPPPEMPADAPPQEEIDPALVGGTPATSPGSCLDDRGQAAAARLVARCIAVSPATHPPCNVANPCEMIQGEIDRSCEMYGPGETRPAECGV